MPMKITNNVLLRLIFALKGNFSKGVIPVPKTFDGVEVAAFKDGAKAAVCISSDFELSWAWRELNSKERELRASRSRRNFPLILEILKKYSIPITWATVGHLFLWECKRGINGLAHSDMPRPSRNDRWKGDWYLHDPCTNWRKDPLWYCPDLIEKIIESGVPHEIGCHSFSHIDFSSTHSDKELVTREIQECESAMRPFGVAPRTLVFPFNVMGYRHLNLLSQLNITAVRHRDKNIKLSYPERTSPGIHKIYESMNLRMPTKYDYLDKVKIFIREALRRQAVYHIYFHPSDPTPIFENEFRRIIKYISDERRKGDIWVATMSELAAYCEARDDVRLEIHRNSKETQIQIRSLLDTARYGTPSLTLVIPVPSPPRQVLLGFQEGSETKDEGEHAWKLEHNRVLINVPVTAKSLKLSS